MTTATKENKIINGVNVTKLEETIQTVRKQPEVAEFKFRAKNKWIDGGENKIEVGDFYGACQEHTRKKPFTFTAE